MDLKDIVVLEENYNKEYRRLRTLTSQTDIVEGSVSCKQYIVNHNFNMRLKCTSNSVFTAREKDELCFAFDY